MKQKPLAVLWVLLIILVFGGCSEKHVAIDYEVFDSQFELTAEFTHGALSGSFVFMRTSPESSTLKFLSPQTVGSMVLTDIEGAVKIEFLGIAHETTRESLKGANPIVALCKSFENFKLEQPNGVSMKNGDIEYTLNNATTLVVFGNYLKQIQVPTEELVINITAFDFLS